MGNPLKKLLKQAGKKQRELAQHLGLEESQMSKWTRGNWQLSPEDLKKMAQFFGITVADLPKPAPSIKNKAEIDLTTIRFNAILYKLRLLLDWMESREFPDTMRAECAQEIFRLATDLVQVSVLTF